MQQTVRFWDGIAERYARSPIKDEDAYAYTLERTASHLGADDRVLELGCGTGTTALHLAAGTGSYMATDLSPNMIAIANRKERDTPIEGLTFRAATLDDIGDGPYDAVLAFNLIHLLTDPDKSLAQIHALLKPGGTFISKTPCRPSGRMPLMLCAMLMVAPLLQLLGKAPYFRFEHISELEERIARAGFEVIETGNYPASPPNHFVVANKL